MPPSTTFDHISEDVHDGYRKKLMKYYEAGKDMPMARTHTYQPPFGFSAECLVGALELRMHMRLNSDPSVKARAEARIEDLTQSGLTLTKPFYDLLAEYEASNKNFQEFLPAMLERLPAMK